MTEAVAKKKSFSLHWLWLIPLFIIALIITAPARVLHWVPLANGIELQGISGSLWQGHAGQIILELPDGAEPLKLRNVNWDLSGWRLFTGTAALHLDIPAADNLVSGDMLLYASTSGVQLRDAKLSGNIGRTIKAFNIPSPLTVDGDWQANIEQLQLASGKNLCQALDADVEGEQIQLQINREWQQLGDYPAVLSCTDGAVNVMMDGNNSMGLQLNALINRQQIRLEGSMKPTADVPAQITELLVYVGKPDASGRYAFAFTL